MTDPIDDDRIASDLAAEIEERIATTHPNADAKLHRRLARLYLAQATGREQAPGEISMRRLGTRLGMSKTLIHQVQHAALAKLWKELHPHL